MHATNMKEQFRLHFCQDCDRDCHQIDDFAKFDVISSIYNKLSFCVCPDQFNAKPEEFFWITYSQVAQVHQGINKSGLNACLKFWVCV